MILESSKLSIFHFLLLLQLLCLLLSLNLHIPFLIPLTNRLGSHSLQLFVVANINFHDLLIILVRICNNVRLDQQRVDYGFDF